MNKEKHLSETFFTFNGPNSAVRILDTRSLVGFLSGVALFAVAAIFTAENSNCTRLSNRLTRHLTERIVALENFISWTDFCWKIIEFNEIEKL